MIEKGTWKWTCDGCGHSATKPSNHGMTGWTSIQVIPAFVVAGRSSYDICPDCTKKAKQFLGEEFPLKEG